MRRCKGFSKNIKTPGDGVAKLKWFVRKKKKGETPFFRGGGDFKLNYPTVVDLFQAIKIKAFIAMSTGTTSAS